MENEKIGPPPCHISRWTNVWNKLAIEVAKPHLNPEWIPDEKVIAEAEAELKDLR